MAKTRVEAPPRNDAYTGMLIISLLAMIGACVLLYMDYSQYENRTPPKVAIPDVPGAARLEKAPPAGARPEPKKNEPETPPEPKPPEKKPEPEGGMMGRLPATGPEHVGIAPIELPPLPVTPVTAGPVRPTSGTAAIEVPEIPPIPMDSQSKPAREEVGIPPIPMIPLPESKPAPETKVTAPEVVIPPMPKPLPVVDPNAPPLNVGVFTPPK